MDAGTLIGGRFEIERLAGRSGMGAVYRAIDRTAGKPAALKILHAEAPEDHRERLEREANAAADKIKSDNWRAGFLKDVVENAAILALDRLWNS